LIVRNYPRPPKLPVLGKSTPFADFQTMEIALGFVNSIVSSADF